MMKALHVATITGVLLLGVLIAHATTPQHSAPPKKTLGVSHSQVLQWMTKDFGKVTKTTKHGEIMRQVHNKSGTTFVETTGNPKDLSSALFYTNITKNVHFNVHELVLFVKNLFADPGQADKWIAGIMKAQKDGQVESTLAFTDIQGRRLRLALTFHGNAIEIIVTPLHTPLFGGH